jgi:ABC-type nitrate/sulfonate/bicarbonate transport system substrate-binding protein
MRQRRVYRLAACLAALAGALAVAGMAGATSQRHSATGLKVCYANAATDFTPAFVAKNEGFFSKNGLDVSLVLASGGKGSQYLTAGICDISLDSATPNIIANKKGADLVLLGADANTFDFRLVAKSSIANVKGLAGKTLALSSPGAAVDIAGRAMLKEFGMSPSDVKIVYISSLATRLAALKSGSIDAMIISPPIGKVLGSGAFKSIYNLKGLHFILSGMFAKRSFAQANPDVVKAYLRSDVQAIAWMKNPANKAGVLKDVGAVTGYTDASDVEEAYDDVLKYQQPEPLIDPRALKNSISWVEDQLNTTIDANSFLYTGPLQQVLTRHLSSKLTVKQAVPRPRGARGTGTFTATLTPAGVLSWRLTAKGLTGKAIYAEVHQGGPGQSTPAKLRLCAPCRAGASGTAKVYSSLLTAFKQSGVFVTVSTAKNPKGEIRGQIAANLG